jgi:hypothetical protein
VNQDETRISLSLDDQHALESIPVAQLIEEYKARICFNLWRVKEVEYWPNLSEVNAGTLTRDNHTLQHAIQLAIATVQNIAARDDQGEHVGTHPPIHVDHDNEPGTDYTMEDASTMWIKSSDGSQVHIWTNDEGRLFAESFEPGESLA